MTPVHSEGLAVRPIQPADRLHLQLLCCEHLMTAGGVPSPDVLNALVDDFMPKVRKSDHVGGGGHARRQPKRGPERVPSIAMLDGQPVAAAVVDYGPDHIAIRRLIVRPKCRRMGVGSYVVYRTAVLPLADQGGTRRGDRPKYFDTFAFLDSLDTPSNDLLRGVGFRAQRFIRDAPSGGDVVMMRLSREGADLLLSRLFGDQPRTLRPYTGFIGALLARKSLD